VVRLIVDALTEFEGLLVALVASTIAPSEVSDDSAEILDRLHRTGTPEWLLDNIRRSAGRWTVCDDDRIDVIVRYAAVFARRPERLGVRDTERLHSFGLSDFDIIDLENIVTYYQCVDRAAEGR
jgi:uncharacterized protein YciW